jgi:hypothetical protein
MRTTERAAVRVVAFVLFGSAMFVFPAHAQDRGLLDDTFILSLGTFFVDSDTEIGLNGSAGQAGTIVDLEGDTGMDDSNRFRVDGLWRIGGGRHHVRALYFDVSRDGSRQVDRELVVGDTVYPVNATVSASLEATIFEVAYEYAFVRRDTLEVAGSIGAHALSFDYGISGNGLVNGQPVNAAGESGDTNAPLPVIGARAMWRFANDWYLDAQGQWFAVELDGIDGSISDLRLGLTWMFSEHVGAGVGWNRFTVDVDASKNSFDGTFDWRYQGAQVFLTGSF